MPNHYTKSFTEAWRNVPVRWLEVIGSIATLAGIIGFGIWARHISPPLPWWNILAVCGGILLLLIFGFLEYDRVRVGRDEAQRKLEDLTTLTLLTPELKKAFLQANVLDTHFIEQLESTKETKQEIIELYNALSNFIDDIGTAKLTPEVFEEHKKSCMLIVQNIGNVDLAMKSNTIIDGIRQYHELSRSDSKDDVYSKFRRRHSQNITRRLLNLYFEKFKK